MKWIEKAQKRFPRLKARDYLWWEGCMVVNDLPTRIDKVPELLNLSGYYRNHMVMLDVERNEMNRTLKEYLSLLKADVIILPGRGAKIISTFLQDGLRRICEDWAYISARRIWSPGTEPKAAIGDFECEPRKVKKVLVVDDVVCSQSTAFQVLTKGSDIFKEASWTFLSWIMHYPRDTKAKSGIRGYDEAYTVYLINGDRRPSCVTFSSLLLSKEILESYAKRYTKDPEGFMGTIRRIEKKLR